MVTSEDLYHDGDVQICGGSESCKSVVILNSLHPSVCMQSKYKADGLKCLPQSLYSHLPETNETQFVRSVSELLSEVRNSNSFSPFVSSTCLCCVGWI